MKPVSPSFRAAVETDLDAIAKLWRAGWWDAHAAIVPEVLLKLRTLDSFRERAAAGLSRTRICGPEGAPAAFHMLKANELNQFYVSADHRGSGLAAAMMADAERALIANGKVDVWLSCAIGNNRAARFYEKTGWRNTGVETVETETSAGPMDFEVWVFRKRLPIS